MKDLVTIICFIILTSLVSWHECDVSQSFDPSKIQIKRGPTKCPKDIYLPYLLTIKWTAAEGWARPKICPLKDLRLHPAAKDIQKGLTVFDALESKLDRQGNVRALFLSKYSDNIKRFSIRTGLPVTVKLVNSRFCEPLLITKLREFRARDLFECLRKLMEVSKPIYRLECNGPSITYEMRTVHTSTINNIEMEPSNETLLYAYLDYYDKSNQPTRFYTDSRYNRVYEGSLIYDIKASANYVPPLMLIKEANRQGFDDVFFLFKGFITEGSTSNIFAVFQPRSKFSGKYELATPPTSYVFNGKTRQLVIQLAKNWTDVELVVRDIRYDELAAAIQQKRLLSMFHTNTVIQAQPIDRMHDAATNLTIEIPINNFIVDRINKYFDFLFYENQKPHPWITVI